MGRDKLRAESPIAKNARKTHCSRGHEFSGHNLIVRPNGQRACRACKRNSDKRYRSTDNAKAVQSTYQRKRYQEDDLARLKQLARHRTRKAIASGKLREVPCEVCGSAIVEAHHDDYSKPFDVRWLCRKHHFEHHYPPQTETPNA